MECNVKNYSLEQHLSGAGSRSAFADQGSSKNNEINHFWFFGIPDSGYHKIGSKSNNTPWLATRIVKLRNFFIEEWVFPTSFLFRPCVSWARF